MGLVKSNIKNFMLHDQDIIDRRFSICQGCEHFISSTNRCKICKCFLRLKTKLSNFQCPVGKWGKEIKGKNIGSHITS